VVAFPQSRRETRKSGGKSRKWQPQKLNKIPGLTAIGGVAKEYTTKCSIGATGGGLRQIGQWAGHVRNISISGATTVSTCSAFKCGIID